LFAGASYGFKAPVISIVMDPYIESLQGLVESRNLYIGRTINQFRPADRPASYNQFMLNERMYLEVLFRILNQEIRTAQNTSQVVLNIPSNFLDSVAVFPTVAQITAAVETIEGAHGNCAVCQDAIVGRASRIRHCGHTYHQECIDNWFTMSVRCPVCRHDIRETAGPVAQTSSGAV
jgi:hypothetical protein